MGTEVTIVEFMPNNSSVEDEDISKQMERSLKSRNQIMTNCLLRELILGAGVKAFVKTAKGEEVLKILLSAVGIKPTLNIGLEEVGIAY
jgi:dihydrolipoamide dehydrogenase